MIRRFKHFNQLNSRKKITKYGSQTQTCSQGHHHNSAGECQYCEKLNLLLKAGEIKSIRYEVHYDLKVNGKKICGHRPDFLVENLDGSFEIHEYKGFATKDWLIKKKLFEALYPEIPYLVKSKLDLY